MTPSIAGQTIVVTGAASGIGRALALGFVADGAAVIGADLAGSNLESLAQEGVLTVTADVTRDAEVRAMIEYAAAETGRVDVLFNNAGVGDHTWIERMPEGAFEHLVAVHLFGALYGLRAALPLMRRQGRGRIINTLSRGAEAQSVGWAAYGSAKAGLLALTRVAAAEAAGADILINGMIPGPTQTGMMKGKGLQEPEAVYPGARWLATLPTGGPTGKVFWDRKEYGLFQSKA